MTARATGHRPVVRRRQEQPLRPGDDLRAALWLSARFLAPLVGAATRNAEVAPLVGAAFAPGEVSCPVRGARNCAGNRPPAGGPGTTGTAPSAR
ncbi:hypothetical protein [Streptomyces sp. NBC_01190]|uniref:hypothetical protein n=1 Tax=Streptomyces sp. NBC_01190 TaxID=2903767 RepID=UPI003865D494|nr:hypothetical protein OG519_17545 [Streptomyces sp. NBC_01190]